MGKRAGRKRLTRRQKIEISKAEKQKANKQAKLPPLSEDGKRIALGVAPLGRIEAIRRA